MIEVPAGVRAKAGAASAERWLRELSALIGDLARAWDISVGAAYTGGTEAYVAAATRRDGTPAVLKGGHSATGLPTGTATCTSGTRCAAGTGSS